MLISFQSFEAQLCSFKQYQHTLNKTYLHKLCNLKRNHACYPNTSKRQFIPLREHPLGDPQGVPLEYLSILYSSNFLSLRKKVFIPRCGSYEMLLYGVPFDSLSFLYLASGNFFISKSNYSGGLFCPPQFCMPHRGSYETLAYGLPFDSLSFLYLTSGNFFDLKNTLGLSRFLTPPIFYPPLREL